MHGKEKTIAFPSSSTNGLRQRFQKIRLDWTTEDNRDRSHFRHSTTATVMIRQSTDVYDDCNIPLAVVSDDLLSGGSSIADNFASSSKIVFAPFEDFKKSIVHLLGVTVTCTKIVQFRGPRHPSPEPLVETVQYAESGISQLHVLIAKSLLSLGDATRQERWTLKDYDDVEAPHGSAHDAVQLRDDEGLWERCGGVYDVDATTSPKRGAHTAACTM
ncbi:hypothetical protein B0H19DRAFT_1071984 [Mycena capillaripes]|nr:hypothetical protein B0H19DRAFT_1071984 [Mycena capillaripes]